MSDPVNSLVDGEFAKTDSLAADTDIGGLKEWADLVNFGAFGTDKDVKDSVMKVVADDESRFIKAAFIYVNDLKNKNPDLYLRLEGNGLRDKVMKKANKIKDAYELYTVLEGDVKIVKDLVANVDKKYNGIENPFKGFPDLATRATRKDPTWS